MSDEERDRELALLAALLETYGGDPSRWPEERRTDAERLIAEDAEAERMSQDAQALDAMLSSAAEVEPSAALRRSVAEIPLRHPRQDGLAAAGWRALLPFGSVLRAALVGAFALSLGVVVGVGAAADVDTGADVDVATLDADWQALEELALLDAAEDETEAAP